MALSAKAIYHALKRWSALQRYASSSSLWIDNNPVEKTIRPIAIATAMLNGLDPARWLADTLGQLPTCGNSQIDSLLPCANSTGNQAAAEGRVAGR